MSGRGEPGAVPPRPVRKRGGRPRRSQLLAPVVALLLAGTGALGVPTPTAEAAVCRYPSQVLNLANWKLQMPLPKPGVANAILEVWQPQLATYTPSPYFVTNAGNCGAGVIFRAPVNGTHTSGSKYPRTELREMTENGTKNAAWSSTSGTHTFTETIAFVAAPQGKGDLVGGQIHNASEDISMLLLRGPNLYLTNGANTKAKLITNGYRSGTRLELKWVVAGGVTKAYINGVPQLTIKRAYSGAYFKAGVYPQANCTNSTPCSSANYGSTIISRLSVTHTGPVAVRPDWMPDEPEPAPALIE